jgi:hypothetical protein
MEQNTEQRTQNLEAKKTGRDFGFSKKTNIALAAITAVSVANKIWQAVAIVIIALVFGSYQFWLDKKK